MRRIYGLLTLLLLPVFWVGLLWLSIKQPGYRKHFSRRLGWNLPTPEPSSKQRVWIHAVSVGETLAIAPLVEMLLNSRSDCDVLVTSTTPTGVQQVQRLFDDRVQSTWFPFDSRGAITRFLNHWQPCVLILVETELWPELIHQCDSRGIKTLLLNARLSERSSKRYGRLGRLVRDAVESLDHIACQHVSDAQHFQALGVSANHLSVAGSLKFDMPKLELEQQRDKLALDLGTRGSGRPILLAASTHSGEDLLVLNAFLKVRKKHPSALLWLAPRHPKRCDAILALITAAKLTAITRSSGHTMGDSTEILLIDTLGELPAFMGLASAVFVGGSLVDHGGHNPLEALVFGKPVISGQFTTNFANVYHALEAENLVTVIDNENALAEALSQSLTLECRERYSLEGPRFVDQHRGALKAQYAVVETALNHSQLLQSAAHQPPVK
ncbi:MAG: 3-deoxy-D-manno-octulosonic acid transferase [Luminiphilus sp.]|nr:3-deoxy-D-manno-octulosonic acid transferase [Luminiphilus sp.]